MPKLTDRAIQNASSSGTSDTWMSDGGARGAGGLYLRVQRAQGKSFYFRYTNFDGKRVAIRLGGYGQKGQSGKLSLADARAQAGELSLLYLRGVRDIKGHLKSLARADERARAEEAEAARLLAEEATRGTFGQLLKAYAADLKRREKSDARSVEATLALHVFQPFGEMCDRKAAEIKPKDVQVILKRLLNHERPKGRTAGKLRSYIHAAYAAAFNAELDPSAPDELRGFGLENNPVAVVKSLNQYQKPGQRTLSNDELSIFLAELGTLSMMTRLALELTLYLGGQRAQQLLRVTPADVHLSNPDSEILLRDPKGRRSVPRDHVLPLIGRGLEIVEELLRINGNAKYLLGSQQESRMHLSTLSKAVTKISNRLMSAKLIRTPFQFRDIRRTAETHLARLRVPKDVRAQILSHGLGGVQDRHYDRYLYMEEKTEGLTKWADHLDTLVDYAL